MSAPGDRPPLRREAIIDEAEELISEIGLEALSLRRLATELRVTAPALYAHVTDKSDLLRAIAERQFDGLLDRYAAIDATLDPSEPIARIRAQCRAYVDCARDDPELFRVMFLFAPALEGGAEAPEGSELPAATRAFNVSSEAVNAAIAAGEIVSDDPLLVALTLWAGVHGVANVLLLGFDMPRDFQDALIDEITTRTLLGYAPTG